MTFNIVELCSVKDKNAYYFINVNEQMGYPVYKLNNNYVTVVSTNNFWRADDVQFKFMKDGTYVVKDGEVIFQG